MEIAEEIAKAKQDTIAAKADLLKQLEAVPEDRLEWSPSETARSPLWIAGHCGGANVAFASFIRGQTPPMPSDLQEVSAAIRATGKDTASREEAKRSVEASVDEVLMALDGLTAETIVGSVDSPFGPMPIRFWMALPAIHMTGHARQLDYLQTIWGDIQDHQ